MGGMGMGESNNCPPSSNDSSGSYDFSRYDHNSNKPLGWGFLPDNKPEAVEEAVEPNSLGWSFSLISDPTGYDFPVGNTNNYTITVHGKISKDSGTIAGHVALQITAYGVSIFSEGLYPNDKKNPNRGGLVEDPIENSTYSYSWSVSRDGAFNAINAMEEADGKWELTRRNCVDAVSTALDAAGINHPSFRAGPYGWFSVPDKFHDWVQSLPK